MPWEVNFIMEHRVVEACYTGILGRAELEISLGKTLEVALSEGTRLFLVDCSRLEGGNSVLDLYDMVNSIEASGFPLVGVRDAMLLPEVAAAQESIGFWETACRNRGINVRVFTSRDKAIEWLTRPESSPTASR